MLGNPGIGPQCPSGTMRAGGQVVGRADKHRDGTCKRESSQVEGTKRRGPGGGGDRDPER